MSTPNVTSSPAAAYVPTAPSDLPIDFEAAIKAAQIQNAFIQEKKLQAAVAEMTTLNTRLGKLNKMLTLTEALLHKFADEPDPDYKRFLEKTMSEETTKLKLLFTQLDIEPTAIFGSDYSKNDSFYDEQAKRGFSKELLYPSMVCLFYRYQFDNISFTGYKKAVENVKSLVDSLSNDQKEAMVKMQKINSAYNQAFEAMTKTQKNSDDSIASIIGRT